jgi:hypothetical protein
MLCFGSILVGSTEENSNRVHRYGRIDSNSLSSVHRRRVALFIWRIRWSGRERVTRPARGGVDCLEKSYCESVSSTQ